MALYLTAIVESPRKRKIQWHIYLVSCTKDFSSCVCLLGFFFGRQYRWFCQHGLYSSWSSATDYVTNKSRLKINICCLMWLAKGFLFRSPKSLFSSYTFIFSLLCFIFVLNVNEKKQFCSTFLHVLNITQNTMLHDFVKSSHLIGISNDLRFRKLVKMRFSNSERNTV